MSSPLRAFISTDPRKDHLAGMSAETEIVKKNHSDDIERLNITWINMEPYCTDARHAERAAHDVSNPGVTFKNAEPALHESRHYRADRKEEGRADRISKKTSQVENKLKSAKWI